MTNHKSDTFDPHHIPGVYTEKADRELAGYLAATMKSVAGNFNAIRSTKLSFEEFNKAPV